MGRDAGRQQTGQARGNLGGVALLLCLGREASHEQDEPEGIRDHANTELLKGKNASKILALRNEDALVSKSYYTPGVTVFQ